MAYVSRMLFRSALVCCLLSVAHAQFQQQGILLFGEGGSGTHSLALSADGTTALVGEPTDNGAVGTVLVFVRSAGAWSQQGQLVGSGSVGSSQQGWSVALSADGNTALVGGPGDSQSVGAAWVFTRSGGVWTEQGGKLTGSDAVGSAHQGMSVGLSADGNTAIFGGQGDQNNTGAAWVFTRTGSVWTQQGAKLVGSGAAGTAEQGWSVALSGDGNTAIVGGWTDNGSAGAAWAFARSAGTWSQQGSKLVGSDASGQSHLGWSTALSSDGNTALLGGFNDNQLAGAAWVFTRSGSTWTQQGSKLTETGSVGPAELGWSVALSANGQTALVGGASDSGGVGAAWVFNRSTSTWSQQANKLLGTPSAETLNQGWSTALSGDGYTALVGTSNNITFVFIDPKPSAITLSGSANFSTYGQSITYTATVTAGATGTVTFAIDGMTQSPVTLTTGIAKFSISNLSPGTHTVTAAYSGDGTFAPANSNAVTQTIAALGAISLYASTMSLDGTAHVTVSLTKPAPPAGLTISLTSSDPSKVTVTPSVLILGGRTSPNIEPQVTGVNLGSVTITATGLGFTSSTAPAYVTATMLFARCCVTVPHSTTLNAVLSLSAPAPASGLTIQLASDSTHVATVPSTITFPAKATTVNVPITGVAAGSTTIHASAPNLASTSVKVTVQ
jgi:hypothetical protein